MSDNFARFLDLLLIITNMQCFVCGYACLAHGIGSAGYITVVEHYSRCLNQLASGCDCASDLHGPCCLQNMLQRAYTIQQMQMKHYKDMEESVMGRLDRGAGKYKATKQQQQQLPTQPQQQHKPGWQ